MYFGHDRNSKQINKTKPVKIPLWKKDELMKAPPPVDKQLMAPWGGRLFFSLGVWPLGGCLCSDGCLYFCMHGDSTNGLNGTSIDLYLYLYQYMT